jgi:hypothetical protein
MKIKLKKLNEYGDIIIVDDELNIGDGVTLNYYSDERPATVVDIDSKGKWIRVQMDIAKRIDKNGMSDCQEYEYFRDEKGYIKTFYKTRIKEYTVFTDTGRSTYNSYGIYLSLKVRRKYFDYTF